MGLNLSLNIPDVSGESLSGRLAEYHQVNFTLLSFSSVLYFSFHDDFEDFVEFVGGEAFDVFGSGIEVASYVSEDGEMGVDGGCIAFEDFKIRFLSRQTEPNTLVISDGVVEDGLNS